MQLNVARVSLGICLVLLAAGSGAIFYAHDASALREQRHGPTAVPLSVSKESLPTPEVISEWKATARTTEYLSPQVPI
jgi:hypothetical protein